MSNPTSYGDGVFGITSDETGVITQSISYDYECEKTELKNKDGNVTGVTAFNETVQITIDGKIPETSPFASLVGASLTLVNSVPVHLQDGVSGLVFVNKVSRKSEMGEYNDVSIDATLYPNISVA